MCGNVTISHVYSVFSVHCAGGDDHHRGVHFRCICVPHELQSQEPGTTRESRGWGLSVCELVCRFKSCQPGSKLNVFVHAVDENGIVFEVEVSRDDVLAALELYKQMCPGSSSLSSLQGVLQTMDKSGVRTRKQ